LMGWEYDRMNGPDGPYLVAIKKNIPVCGIAPLPPSITQDGQSFWLSYIEVDAIDDVVKRAEDAGAMVVRAPMDVPEVGRIAVIKDVAGALIGFVTPDFDD